MNYLKDIHFELILYFLTSYILSFLFFDIFTNGLLTCFFVAYWKYGIRNHNSIIYDFLNQLPPTQQKSIRLSIPASSLNVFKTLMSSDKLKCIDSLFKSR